MLQSQTHLLRRQGLEEHSQRPARQAAKGAWSSRSSSAHMLVIHTRMGAAGKGNSSHSRSQADGVAYTAAAQLPALIVVAMQTLCIC